MENYTTIKKLGKGACGDVYLVKHNESTKFYALKTIQLDEGRKNRTKSAVMREAKILAQLKHPNIVAYHDSFFEGDEHLCIVQDYCDGGTLDEIIQETEKKRQYLGEKQVMQWFIQITMAVQFMHSQKVLHRDLKTQNVFMNKGGGNTCRLGDFGISKMMDTTIDMASTCVGTPCYLAPEMCQDIPYSSKADVWALGCLLYEMCALRPAFDANNLISLFYKIVKADVDRLPSQYSDAMNDLIKSILVKNPEERPSARQILVLPYVKEQMTDFIMELMTLSEMRDKESPSKPRARAASKTPKVKVSNSAESSPRSSRATRKSQTNNNQMSQTFDSAIKLPIPITPRSAKQGKNVCQFCGQTFTLKSFLTKHIENKHSGSKNQSSSRPNESELSLQDTPVRVATVNRILSSGDKRGIDEEDGPTTPGDPLYEDDFEDSNSEDEVPTSRKDGSNLNNALYDDEIPEALEVSDLDEGSDPEVEENEYEDDFEEYDSDEDLNGIVSHCRVLHEGDHDSDEDELIMDTEPSNFMANCKNLLQEHAIQTLGKTKYKEIRKKGKITDEDTKLKVEHKAGKEHLETCFLVSELLSESL